MLKSLLSKKTKLEVFLNHFIVPKNRIIALENQCAEKLNVSCDQVATMNLLPSGSKRLEVVGYQAERKQGRRKKKCKKQKGSRKK